MIFLTNQVFSKLNSIEAFLNKKYPKRYFVIVKSSLSQIIEKERNSDFDNRYNFSTILFTIVRNSDNYCPLEVMLIDSEDKQFGQYLSSQSGRPVLLLPEKITNEFLAELTNFLSNTKKTSNVINVSEGKFKLDLKQRLGLTINKKLNKCKDRGFVNELHNFSKSRNSHVKVYNDVKLSEIIPKHLNSYSLKENEVDQFNKTTVDFLICVQRNHINSKLVIELDGKTHEDPVSILKDKLKNRVLKANNIQLLRLNIDNEMMSLKNTDSSYQFILSYCRYVVEALIDDKTRSSEQLNRAKDIVKNSADLKEAIHQLNIQGQELDTYPQEHEFGEELNQTLSMILNSKNWELIDNSFKYSDMHLASASLTMKMENGVIFDKRTSINKNLIFPYIINIPNLPATHILIKYSLMDSLLSLVEAQ